jgi:hypothetical protein
VRDVYDDPMVIPSVQYILNSHKSAETDFTPFELTFGTQESIYQDLFKDVKREPPKNKFLKRLDANLSILKEASTAFQRSLNKDRGVNSEPEKHNKFAKGDFVMFDAGSKPNPKMSSRNKGPFRVIDHTKNDVQVRNLVTDAIVKCSSHDLTAFYGDEAGAYHAACHDNDQFVVKRVISYSGNCERRTEMSFLCEFEDGSIVDITWTRDLLCQAFDAFCKEKPYLYHLTLDAKAASKFKSMKNRDDIQCVGPGDTVYVDLRFFGGRWYESLDLPEGPTSSYVMEFKYSHWYADTSFGKPVRRGQRNPPAPPFTKNHICDEFTLLKPHLPERYYAQHWKTYMVYCYGEQRVFNDRTMVLVDDQFVRRYPRILERV